MSVTAFSHGVEMPFYMLRKYTVTQSSIHANNVNNLNIRASIKPMFRYKALTM